MSPTRSEKIIETYERNQQIANTKGWPLFMLGFILFGGGGYLVVRPTVPFVGFVLVCVGVIVAGAGLRVIIAASRCPECKGLLQDRRGRIVSPTACPHCGVRLTYTLF